MTTFTVAIPDDIPTWISYGWTETGACLVLECQKCKTMHAFYTTALRLDSESFSEAVEQHRGCRP